MIKRGPLVLLIVLTAGALVGVMLARQSPRDNRDQKLSPAQVPSTGKTTVVTPTAIPDVSSPTLGIYVGPGAVVAHKQFEQWLGRPVPLATDYVDYKGGWQKDFIESRAWLTQRWGSWVRQRPGNRLVLGVPLLQNSDYGRFDRGAAGAFDSYFRALSAQLVAHGLGHTIIRLGYEANNELIGPWEATHNPAGYKQMFRHVVAIMRSVPGAAFTFDWTVANGHHPGRFLGSFDSFYPGDDVVDIVGMNIYDIKWKDPKATAAARWSAAVNRHLGIRQFLSFAARHRKPISYPEWGLYRPGDDFAGGGDNPYFIRRMANLITTTKPVYHSYFDVDWGGGELRDFPRGRAEYRALFVSRK